MMPHSIKTAVPNGVRFIADGAGGLAPDPIRGVPIQATCSCIAAGCLMDSEGETAITVGPSRAVDPGYSPSFDGELDTPTRTLTVSTVNQKKILETGVPTGSTRVRIWVNHPTFPDNVIIGLN